MEVSCNRYNVWIPHILEGFISWALDFDVRFGHKILIFISTWRFAGLLTNQYRCYLMN